MKNNSKKHLLRVLNNEIISPPPFWFMRQAGRYLPEYQKIRQTEKNFLSLCYSINKAVEISLQPILRFNPDGIILFSDILVIPDALGQEVTFKKDIGPILNPIKTISDIKKLNIYNMIEYLNPVFEIIKILVKKIPETATLIGFAGGPWTVVVYMIEGKSSKECTLARLWAYKNPKSFKLLINLITDATIEYLINQIRSGVEVVQLFDSWAGVLSEEQFKEWVIKPNKKIVAKIKSIYPDIPIIGFPRNAGSLYLDFVEQTNVDCINIDHSVSLEWAAKNLQRIVPVQGNLDNHLLLVGGKPLETGIKNILKSFDKGSFIFNLGHGILPSTPVKNVYKMSQVIRNWTK
jgi:uroporphyrinogen decarboxylase